MRVWKYVCVGVWACEYACVCVCEYVCVHVCVNVCMFVCMYACVWAYVCGFCRALWDVLEYRMCVCNYVSMCVVCM